MVLQPTQHILILTGLYLLRPKVVIIPMAAKSWNADAYSILCSADDAVFSLWVILKAEHEARKGFWIHVRQVVRPDAAYDVTRAG